MVYRFGRNTVDIIGDAEGYMHYIVNGLFVRKSKLHHNNAGMMYFTARFPDRTTKRMYLNAMVEYR